MFLIWFSLHLFLVHLFVFLLLFLVIPLANNDIIVYFKIDDASADGSSETLA